MADTEKLIKGVIANLNSIHGKIDLLADSNKDTVEAVADLAIQQRQIRSDLADLRANLVDALTKEEVSRALNEALKGKIARMNERFKAMRADLEEAEEQIRQLQEGANDI